MAEEKKGFFKRLVSGLTKTRDNIVAGFDSLFTGYSTIDDDFYEELEEILIMGDIGINATTAILDKLKDQVEIRNIRDPKECKQLLIDTIKEQMTVDSTEYEFENRKSVILVIGVNGVGKTTCRQAEGPGQKGYSWCCGYFPCSSRGTADPVGEPGRSGDHWRSGWSRPGISCL